MENVNDESEQIREVYARFGLAMYFAQCLERGLALLLATEFGPGVHKITRTEFDELLESFFKQTLGGLVSRLKSTSGLPTDFTERLREVLEVRNRLTHRYFWERAGKFATSRGRGEMLNELETMHRQLEKFDDYFGKVMESWATQHGITKEVIDDFESRLVEEDLTTRFSGPPRSL